MSTRTSRLRPEQRKRLRRVLRWGLSVVIGAEVLVIALAATPASAVVIVCSIPCPVYDSQVDRKMWDIWRRITQDINLQQLGTIPNVGMNGLLSDIERDQDRIFERERQHSRDLSDDWSANLAAVTETPTDKLQGISFADASPGDALGRIVPGAVPWENYYEEYITSADTALSTLRTSLDALYEHNQQIEDDAALTRIASLAGGIGGSGGTGGKGLLAMDELEVQSSLEVARQLQALRAQYAISTGIYAVAESHRLGAEARTQAEDTEANCRILASAIGGPLGAVFC